MLVTGGSGYVGSRVVDKLVANGVPVRVLETMAFGNPLAHLEGPRCEFVQGDITDVPSVRAAMRGVTHVIHLAGIVTDELVDMNRAKGHRVNVDGTQIVVDEAMRAGVERLLFASSSSVYGLAAQEGVPDEYTAPQPQTAYAEQKLEAERIVLQASNDMVTTAVRQATACGPAPRMRLDTVVNIFSKQAWFDGLVTPYGGTQYRSNIHVADAASFYFRLLRIEAGRVNGLAWNLTMGNMPVGAIAQAVASTHNAIYSDRHRARVEVKDVADARSYRLNGERVRAVLDFHPMFTVQDAARHNFEFFRASGLNPAEDIYYNNRRMRAAMMGD